MIELAQYYKFDGWFINIECNLSDHHPHAPKAFIHFLNYLKRAMKTLNPLFKVLWYDSVTVNGLLQWQDTLNDLNLDFFKAADGIFVNYTWKRDGPFQSARVAGDVGRDVGDVYTGIDVWGRNSFGGGGWNVHKALEVIHEAKTSVALFAPAW
jgi:mannosyl-glycoprotein endo-beta-N-acetylglucosaminidase